MICLVYSGVKRNREAIEVACRSNRMARDGRRTELHRARSIAQCSRRREREEIGA
jgi:hypothetical protein